MRCGRGWPDVEFYLGTHEETWLARPARPDVAMMVSRRRLIRRPRKTPWPKSRRRWVLDSGGFTQLRDFGRWTITARQYAEEVHTWSEQFGSLIWTAPMDWMCEEIVIKGGAIGRQRFAGTGLSVPDHQERTVANYLELTTLAPHLPWIPVLQGDDVGSYWRCFEMYRSAEIDLAAEPVVGLGSVCRRQATTEIAELVTALAGEGLRLHGFGVKTGAHRLEYADWLTSADSLAWSDRARHIAQYERQGRPLPGCTHRSCANCWRFAIGWRDNLVAQV